MASVRFRPPLAAVLLPAGALACGRVPGGGGAVVGGNPVVRRKGAVGPLRGERAARSRLLGGPAAGWQQVGPGL
jgi:hypothetical protein